MKTCTKLAQCVFFGAFSMLEVSLFFSCQTQRNRWNLLVLRAL